MRFLRGVREYERSRDVKLTVVALYTDNDAHAPFVRYADEAVHIGPAMQPGPDGSLTSAYILHDKVVQAIKDAGCDAVWPGWGFVSEDPRFVARLEEEDIVFLGPSSQAIQRLGDKLASKRLARRCDVPMTPWAEITDDMSEERLVAAANEVGYPLMVKASAGGGGRGIRRVDGPSELVEAVAAVKYEVDKVFGQGGVFMEKCVVDARHIEVQMVVGADGRAETLGVRDCSLQRRSQKVVEEAPSPILPPLMEKRLREGSERLAEAAGYIGVGTAEFLYVPTTGEATFLEVNSRLQVEHTVTEAITGCDLVHIQIDIARGLPWQRPETQPGGWAIEARLNAENPEKGFRPSPGRIQAYRPPSGPGIRVDSGVEEGTDIAPEFDSMIAKVIAWGPTRDMAIARLERALQEFEVLVEDGSTNKAFILEILQNPQYRNGKADTRWLDRATASGELANPDRSVEALLIAAVVTYNAEHNARVSKFFRQVHDGVPQDVPAPKGLDLELKLRGEKVKLSVHSLGGDHYLVGDADAPHFVKVEHNGPNALMLTVDGKRTRALIDHGRAGIAVELDGVLHNVERSSGGLVAAPAPALVAHVAVEVGDVIKVGDPICTLEAMKMETVLFSEEAGTVSKVLVRANSQVQAGQPLVILAVEEGEGSGAGEIKLPAPPEDALAHLMRLKSLDDTRYTTDAQLEGLAKAVTGLGTAQALGFELPQPVSQRLLNLLSDEEAWRRTHRPQAWKALTDVLHAFVSVEGLFDRALLDTGDQPVAVSPQMAFYEFCREHHAGEEGARPQMLGLLRAALSRYGVHSLNSSDELREALWRATSGARHNGDRYRLVAAVLMALVNLHEAGMTEADPALRRTLENVALLAGPRQAAVADAARQASYSLFQRPHYLSGRGQVEAAVGKLAATNGAADAALLQLIRVSGHDLMRSLLGQRPNLAVLTGAMTRLNPQRTFGKAHTVALDGGAAASWAIEGGHILAAMAPFEAAAAVAGAFKTALGSLVGPTDLQVFWTTAPGEEAPTFGAAEGAQLTETFLVEGRVTHRNWIRTEQGWVPAGLVNVHPAAVERMGLHLYEEFDLQRLASTEHIHAYLATAKSNPKDERVLVHAEVFELPEAINDETTDAAMHAFERQWFEALRVIRNVQSRRGARRRLNWNRLTFHLSTPVATTGPQLARIASKLEPHTRGLGLEVVVIRALLKTDGEPREVAFEVRRPGGHRVQVSPVTEAPTVLQPVDNYDSKVVRCRRLRVPYPYEVVKLICGQETDGRLPHRHMVGGSFQEMDLDDKGALVPVDRAPGLNKAGVVVGMMTSITDKHPAGMKRVWIASDPTRAMGSLAQAECERICAAIELAKAEDLPVEWIAISAGARIAMDSGTENLDWTARVLKSIVQFTQDGGEIHVIVPGVNVGAQSYWNAEATMLMHTKGVLIMTPDGSMVLTGKRALEISGGVSAEDEKGIGGYERIMGPNGQAQYHAKDLGEAYKILFDYYAVAYRSPNEKRPRALSTTDAVRRDVCESLYTGPAGDGFTKVGEIFDNVTNAGRKKPFSIRALMEAVKDTDSKYLERFRSMTDAETAVVWDTHMGGHAITMIGIESRPIPRAGRIPLDGPDTWAGGTLFPKSSKKVARALNAASGSRPVVVMANLSGFDGSPESLRKIQLEYGAEIGRAIVNFEGPVVFVVVGRYHGGAYVVFSKALNPNLTSMAVEGSFASVIGGAPAAAVVFPREVRSLVEKDPRIVELNARIKSSSSAARPRLQQELAELYEQVTLEKRGEVATKFDGIHSVQRAVEVGSLDAVIEARHLRPAIVGVLQGKKAGELGDDREVVTKRKQA